jgi:hypothetical protein
MEMEVEVIGEKRLQQARHVPVFAGTANSMSFQSAAKGQPFSPFRARSAIHANDPL